MDFVTCKLFMHMGGKFLKDPLRYDGGEVQQWDVEPDNLRMSTLSAMVVAAGFREVKHFSYVEPGRQFRTGLRVCYDIASFGRLLNHMKVQGAMHIFVDHHDRREDSYIPQDHLNEVVADSFNDDYDDEQSEGDSHGDENFTPSDDNRGDATRSFIADLGYNVGKNFLKNPEGIKEAIAALVRKKNCGGINDNAPELCNPDGSSSDCIDSDDAAEESVSEDGEVVFKRVKITFYDPCKDPVSLGLGMVFEDYKQFKHALAKYCIQNHFDIEYEKNESKLVTAHCKADFCPFKIAVGLDNKDDSFKIKKFDSIHDCTRVFRNSRAKYKLLGEEFLPKLRILPSLTVDAMLQFAKEEMEIDVSKSTMIRAKNWALEQINGKESHEFNKLFDYVKELRKVDPEGNFELMVERASPSSPINFRRLYIGFSNLREGFLKFCRPIICLDGCFLKGNWEGEIICAIGRDGNEHIWPIAWAVVEKENMETWGWFLANLKHDLEISEGEGFTFMTDQQKGLKQEIKQMFPRVEHRVCARHLYSNWKVKNPGNDNRTTFWARVKASTEPVYQINLQRLKELNSPGATQLLRTDPKQWARSFFSTRSAYDAVTNNHAESFNATIKLVRGCSILTMLEAIRKYSMDRILKYMKKSAKWTTVFTPTTEAQIKENKKISQKCRVRWNGGAVFEIECRGIQHVVNLSTKTCTCRNWDLTSIPCPHALASISWKKLDMKDYVGRWYKTEDFIELYTKYPVPGVCSPDFWKRTNIGPIEPPLKTPMPGRKKKNRTKENGEVMTNDGTKLSRAGSKNKCSNCSQPGHNKTSCPQKQKGTNMGDASNSQRRYTGEASNNQAARNDEIPNTEINLAEVASYEEMPNTNVNLSQPLSTNDIPEDLFTLYPTSQSCMNDDFQENEEPYPSSPVPSVIGLPVQETGYTVYEPRPPKPKKKKVSNSAKSLSQPNPERNRINEIVEGVSSQPTTSNAEILAKFTSRGKQILDAAGILGNENERLTGGTNPRKRKANFPIDPKTGGQHGKDKGKAKQTKQRNVKQNPIWKF